MNSRYVCTGCLRRLQTQSCQSLHRSRRQPLSTQAHSDQAKLQSLRKTPLHLLRQQSTASAFNEVQRDAPSASPLAQRYEKKFEKDIRRLNLVLDKDDLFHPFSQSPLAEMRRRAAYIKSHAYCPHPDHQRTRMPVSPTDPEHRKTADLSRLPPRHVNFECPDCGIPTYCSEEHWADDYEQHMEICDTLRQINEDDHDLRSGRRFHEFENLPTWEGWEIAVSMADWDSYLYTQEYRAVDSDRSQRHLTAQLTYPMTINGIVHEHSPYHQRKNNRVTNEGLRSFTALRHSLHPFKDHRSGGLLKYARPRPPPTRIFILGARAECALNADIWNQLPNAYLDNHMHIDLNLIGPEAFLPKGIPFPERKAGNPFGGYIEDRINPEKMMKLITYKERYQTMHEAQYFHPFDPYFDCFVLFHPGLGHPASSHEWQDALPQLLATKCPIICTGYSQWDMERDRKWVHEQSNGEYDVLMTPGENVFRSLKWDLNDLEPQDISCGNWGVWAFRGKRYVISYHECELLLILLDMRLQPQKMMSLDDGCSLRSSIPPDCIRGFPAPLRLPTDALLILPSSHRQLTLQAFEQLIVMSSNMVTVAVAQSHTRKSTSETLTVLQQMTQSAAEKGVHLILFPEAYLGGYPRSCDFGSSIGARTDEGRDQFLKHFQSAVDLGDTPAGAGDAWLNRTLEVKRDEEYRGDGTRERLESIASTTGVFLVVGVIERAGGSLYCSVVYVSPTSGCIGKRRKVMPTGTERTIWAQGSTSTLRAATADLNGVKVTLAAAVCWENYMPLLRFSLYSQNINLYLAPTADARDTWLPLLQTIACEGRCFVLSSNQCMRKQGSQSTHNMMNGNTNGDTAKKPTRRRSVITKTEDNHEISWPCPDVNGKNGAEGVIEEELSSIKALPERHQKQSSLVNGSALGLGDEWACRGGSCIIAPNGKVLAGPSWETEDCLTTATIDFDDCIRGKLDFDAAGSYSRMDSFELKVKDLDLSPPP